MKKNQEKPMWANMKKRVERRKNRRLQVTRDAFVALGPYYLRVGQIIDVSMDGLAFRCFGAQEPSNRSFELDIFLAGTAFYLHKVPFKTISDLEVADEAWSRSIKIRRYGVQLGQLTSNQTSQLEYFIQNYTIGEA